MRAIFINAKERTVTEVNIGTDIADINKLLGSRCFTVGHVFENEDAVYVDDEGEYHPEDLFELGDAHQPFCGNGLIIGTDIATGESVDCKTATTDIHNDIMWFDVATFRRTRRSV